VNRVLIIEDDETISEYISDYLRENGYDTTCSCDLVSAKQRLSVDSFDIVLLDINLPDGNGISLFEQQNIFNSTPVIVLSALADVDDKILGLTKGAKDYITKPFDPRELLLRMKNIIGIRDSVCCFGDYKFNVSQKTLFKNDEEVYLTSSERNVVAMLCKSKLQIVSREDLRDVLGVYVNDRTIDTVIARLRAKIEDSPKNPKYIRTERHKGYYIVLDNNSPA